MEISSKVGPWGGGQVTSVLARALDGQLQQRPQNHNWAKYTQYSPRELRCGLELPCSGRADTSGFH
jgi:hypothetical protein